MLRLNLSLSFIFVSIICPNQSKHGNEVKRGKKQVFRHQGGGKNASRWARLSNADISFGVKARITQCAAYAQQ